MCVNSGTLFLLLLINCYTIHIKYLPFINCMGFDDGHNYKQYRYYNDIKLTTHIYFKRLFFYLLLVYIYYIYELLLTDIVDHIVIVNCLFF